MTNLGILLGMVLFACAMFRHLDVSISLTSRQLCKHCGQADLNHDSGHNSGHKAVNKGLTAESPS